MRRGAAIAMGGVALTSGRAEAAAAARSAALLALGFAIILSPFRARILLEERAYPPVFADYRDFLLFWNEIVILLVLALWGASLLLHPRRIDLGPLLVRAPVALLLLAAGLSTVFAADNSLAIFHAVTLIGFVALALFVINEVRSVSDLAPAIAIMVVVQAIVAIGQVIDQASFGLHAIGEFDLDPMVNGVSIVWTEDAPLLLRGYGLSDHPNILGGVLAAAILVIAGSLARLKEKAVPVACAVFGAGVAALLVTFSRSAALGLAAGLLLAFAVLLARRDWHTAGLWFAACLVALVIAAPLVKPYSAYLGARVNPTAEPAGGTEGRSLSEREALTRNTNEIFVDQPLTGVGIGVLPTAMRETYPEFQYNYQPAHFVILVVAAETGILGAFAYGVLMIGPWLLIWLRRHQLTPELIGVSAAFLALQVIGLFDYYTWSLTAGRLWFWLVLGLWAVAYKRATEEATNA